MPNQLRVPEVSDSQWVEKWLNDLGAQGWELIHHPRQIPTVVGGRANWSDDSYYVFKRRLND